MKVILVYREEADGAYSEPHQNEPFSGVEVVGVANDDDDALDQIDRIKERASSQYVADAWKFHIDSV